MAPPDGGGREPLMSMEEIDALLLGSLDDTEGAGHAVPPWWRTMLHVIPLKKKLELLTLSLGFEERLRKASPKEVHNMVDQGIFKVLCMQLGGFRGIDAAHELWGTGFAVCTDRISTFLDTCPELCAKAWAYGVVPPVTAVVMKKRDLSNPKVLRDQPLRAALGFLVSMGVPWQDQLDDPRSQQGEATKATGKCYCWMTKEGVVDAVVEIWCALPKFDSKDREDSHFSKLSSYCAAVLWYATSVHLKRPPLASNAELVKPVLHYLLHEPTFSTKIRSVSLSLMQHLWLFHEPDVRPEAAHVRRAIAQHDDAWKLADRLRDGVVNPDQPLEFVKLYEIIECSFVILLRLLCFPPTRPVPRPLLETLCRLLGTFSDPGCWTEARHLVVDLYRVGTLSDRLLLTHAFPGLLRAFTAEVARCGRATSPTKLLRDMTNVLTQAFGRALQTVSERQGLPVEPSLVEVGVSLAFESLPSLAELSVKTGAAEALVSLTESQLYGQAIMLCAAIAESLPPDGPMIRQLLDQNVPSIVLQIYEDRQGSWGRNMERALLLRYITRVVRPGNPVLKFVNMRPLGKVTHSARGRRAEYDYEENEVSFGAGLCIGKERLMLDLFQALDADSPECRLARLGLEEIEREAPSVVKEKKCSDAPKESKCCVCETEGAALKRCSLCREVAYCTVACQRKHWPEHKLVCKRKGKKNR